ncbi:MAG: hypothetical protein ACLUE2_15880 [Bacteroides cellulosilyticus]
MTFSLLEAYKPAQNQKYPLAARLLEEAEWGSSSYSKPLWRRLSCQQYGTAYLARRHPEYIG